jgi:hypothetical protein
MPEGPVSFRGLGKGPSIDIPKPTRSADLLDFRNNLLLDFLCGISQYKIQYAHLMTCTISDFSNAWFSPAKKWPNIYWGNSFLRLGNYIFPHDHMKGKDDVWLL